MPRSKTVVLGGNEYAIEQLPMRANREWRERLGTPITNMVGLLNGYKDIEINTMSDLAGVVTIAKELLLGSMDFLLEALFDYAPSLKADRERIENEAYDDEAIAALGACVLLAYPLDQAVTGLMRGGLPVTQTSTKSLSTNGDSGTKPATAGRQRSTTKT